MACVSIYAHAYVYGYERRPILGSAKKMQAEHTSLFVEAVNYKREEM